MTLNKPWTSVCLHSSCLLPLFIMLSNIPTFWSHGPGNLRSTADILSEGQITVGNTIEHSAMSQLHLPQWIIVLHFLLVFFLIVSNMTVSVADVCKLALNPSYGCQIKSQCLKNVHAFLMNRQYLVVVMPRSGVQLPWDCKKLLCIKKKHLRNV